MNKRFVIAAAFAAAVAGPAVLSPGKTTALRRGTIPAADHPRSTPIRKRGSMFRKDIASALSAGARHQNSEPH